MSDTRVLRLREFGAPVEVVLAPAERDALWRAPAGLDLRPIFGTAELYEVRATSLVGLVRAGDLLVEIEPKVPIARVLYLLGFALDVPELECEAVDAQATSSLVEAVAWIYSRLLRRALARGLPQGYREAEDDLTTVRGRIQFERQLRTRPHTWLPTAVRHDEFTEDIPLNRVLKAAVRRLLQLPLEHRKTALDLRRWLRVFSGVADLPIGVRHLPTVRTNRLQAHVDPALDLARLVVRGGAVDSTAGATSVPGLVLDLADLFERFVRRTMRRSLVLSRSQFPPAGGPDLYLDRGRKVRIKPDLSWREGDRFVFVGDVKYKASVDRGGRQGDLYQLLAYATRCRTGRALLIHASAAEQVVHEIVGGSGEPIRLEIVGIDLDVEPRELVAQVEEVARRIAERVECATGQVAVESCEQEAGGLWVQSSR